MGTKIIEEHKGGRDADIGNRSDFPALCKVQIEGLLKELENKYGEDMKNLKSNFLTEEIRWLICFLRKQLALEVYKRRIKSPEDEYKDKNKKLYSDEDDEEDYDQIAEAELNNYKESDDIQKQMLKLVFSPIIKEVQRCVTYKDFSKILGRDEDMKPLEENHSYQTFITKYCKLLQAALFRDLSMIEE